MNSSKDKATRHRPHNRKRRPSAVDPAGERSAARARWPYLAVIGVVCAAVLSYGWLSYQANSAADRQTRRDPAARQESITTLAEQLRQAEQSQDETKIERSLLSLIEADSGNSKWLMQLCEFYFSQARWSAATELFVAEISRSYSPAAAYPLQGTMLNALINFGQAAEARLILDPLLSRAETKSLEMAQMEARLLRLEGRSQAALELLASVLPKNHLHEPLYKLQGMLEFDLGQYGPALASLERASQLNPYSESTQFKLAECARLLGDQAAAQQYRQRYAQLQAIQQEIASLKVRLEQSPDWTETQALRLASLYESIGQPQQAAYCKQQIAARRKALK